MRSFLNVAVSNTPIARLALELDRMSPGILQGIIAIRVNVELGSIYCDFHDEIKNNPTLLEEARCEAIDEYLSTVCVCYEFENQLTAAVEQRCLEAFLAPNSMIRGVEDYFGVDDEEVTGDIVFEGLVYVLIYSDAYCVLDEYDAYLKDVFLDHPIIDINTNGMYYDRQKDSYIFPVLLYTE